LQIGAHCYYLKSACPADHVRGLLECFFRGLDCHVQRGHDVTYDIAKKAFDNIAYVSGLLKVRPLQTFNFLKSYHPEASF
jgi:hypothetical protein